MARYKAITEGFMHKPVSVTRNDKTFHTDYIIAGDEFEFDGPKGLWMKEIKSENDDDRDKIIEQLKEKGIKYYKGAPTEKLAELLNSATEA